MSLNLNKNVSLYFKSIKNVMSLSQWLLQRIF